MKVKRSKISVLLNRAHRIIQEKLVYSNRKLQQQEKEQIHAFVTSVLNNVIEKNQTVHISSVTVSKKPEVATTALPFPFDDSNPPSIVQKPDPQLALGGDTANTATSTTTTSCFGDDTCWSSDYQEEAVEYEVVPPTTTTLKFTSSVFALPKMNVHQSKNDMNATITHQIACGEDAFYIDDDSLGVCDGVNGWKQMNVDPSIFSRKLMDYCKETAPEYQGTYEVLHAAYAKLLRDKTVAIGSATCCLLKITENNNLNVLNVGDSGAIVIRKIQEGNGPLALSPDTQRRVEIVYKSPVQQHTFNLPYQLGKGYQGAHKDGPAQSVVQNFQLQEEDIVILASDGLFDNLFEYEIVTAVEEQLNSQNVAFPMKSDEKKKLCYEISKALVMKSRMKLFTKQRSPFGVQYEAHHQKKYTHGGKLDDITVVCSTVTSKTQND